MSGASSQITQRRASDAGFSLIEALVSLAVLAMLIAALPPMLRMARQTLALGERVTNASIDTAAIGFVTEKLSEAKPIRTHALDGLQSVQFSGDPRAVTFVAPLQTGGPTTGLYRFKLAAIVTEAGREQVELTWWPYRQREGSSAPPDIRRRTVLANAPAFRLRYHPSAKAAATGPDWRETWSAGTLPAVVEFSYASKTPRPTTVVRRVELRARQ